MRTTVTLEPEAEALIRKAMAKHGWSLREAVNAGVIAGLGGRAGARFETPTYPLGGRPIAGDKVLALAGELEDAELIRKYEQGK
jgi:hypothetical protein